MTVRKGASFNAAEVVCYWCKQDCPNSPYRAPIVGIIGARYVVCGPTCPEKPQDALVLTDWRASS